MEFQLPGAWVEDPSSSETSNTPDVPADGQDDLSLLSESSEPFLNSNLAQYEPFYYDLITAFSSLILDCYKRLQIPQRETGPIPGMFLLKTGPPSDFHRLQFSSEKARKEHLATLVKANPTLKVRTQDPDRPVLKIGVDYIISPCYDTTVPDQNVPSPSPASESNFSFIKGSPISQSAGARLSSLPGSSARRLSFHSTSPAIRNPALRRASVHSGFSVAPASPLTPMSQRTDRINKPRALSKTSLSATGSLDIFKAPKDTPGQDVHEGHSCIDAAQLAHAFMVWFLERRVFIPRVYNSEANRKLHTYVQRYVDEATKGKDQVFKESISTKYKQAWYNLCWELRNPTASRPGSTNPDGSQIKHPWIHGDEFIHGVTTSLSNRNQDYAIWRFGTSMSLAKMERLRLLNASKEWHPDLFAILNRKVAPYDDGRPKVVETILQTSPHVSRRSESKKMKTEKPESEVKLEEIERYETTGEEEESDASMDGEDMDCSW